MIPAFDAGGNLPPGIHQASWREIVMLFGRTAHRRSLLAGMKEAFQSLKRANCRMVYLDGSFVTDKEAAYGAPPDDFDGCWDPEGVDPNLLDPVLLDFENKRAAQKAKFGGELFISLMPAAPQGPIYLEFFQIDKRTGGPKGIIALDLAQLQESEWSFDPAVDLVEETKLSTPQFADGIHQPRSVLLCFDRKVSDFSTSSRYDTNKENRP